MGQMNQDHLELANGSDRDKEYTNGLLKDLKLLFSEDRLVWKNTRRMRGVASFLLVGYTGWSLLAPLAAGGAAFTVILAWVPWKWFLTGSGVLFLLVMFRKQLNT